MREFTLSSTGTPIAGGTTLIDLMKLGVMSPSSLVDLYNDKRLDAEIELDNSGLSIGALATMTSVAEHPGVFERYPAITQSILQAASPQIRNMATIGGNLLQRTRCSYFRHIASACNKRNRGSGCDAITGDQHGLAVLGRSESCVASYPGDLAVVLVALDAELTCIGEDGKTRVLPVSDLHCLPGKTPHIEHNLRSGERIMKIQIPRNKWTHSSYTKLRDRASYAFARASVALCVCVGDNGVIQDAAIALGGLATRPWRCTEAERLLFEATPEPKLFKTVAEKCFEEAMGDAGTIAIGKASVQAALTRALLLGVNDAK